jgi:hypothetical protein
VLLRSFLLFCLEKVANLVPVQQVLMRFLKLTSFDVDSGFPAKFASQKADDVSRKQWSLSSERLFVHLDAQSQFVAFDYRLFHEN